MTREEFRDIDSWGELLDVASETSYDGFYDVCDNIDDVMDRIISEWLSSYYWYQIRDRLCDIPTCDYYIINEYDDFYDAYDFFDERKDEFEEYLDDIGYFDDDEDEEDECAESGDGEMPFEMDFDLDELFAGTFTEIQHVETTTEDEDEALAMLQMLAMA